MPEHHFEAGLRVGLLGGAFNPAHEGHLHISLFALTALELDRIVWLVSPGHPFKPEATLKTFETRLEQAHALCAPHPKLEASDFEKRHALSATYDTMRALKARFGAVRFVWLMGADVFAGFERWHRWADVAHEMPIAVISRPGAVFAARRGAAFSRFADKRVSQRDAQRLAFSPPPAICFLDGPRSPLSASALREADGE